ncbi:histidine kinase [Thalassotalea profundi]|uniref:Histidine kinase n=1 Tax=Thalassotalea profundi TaxID=2036687 RepID=A0ABQ3IEB4_9GAMM|nr:histidine kinase [Thalassotalea profundi]GHE77750.1 hypothetical protein GCM10011501_01730 [Thalassotalea profundi]
MSSQHNDNEANESNLNQLIHDARGPLNRISMQAEMIKLVLESGMPIDKAVDAANKIITSCQECSQTLEQLSKTSKS